MEVDLMERLGFMVRLGLRNPWVESDVLSVAVMFDLEANWAEREEHVLYVS
jgi:hypothetical protein